MSRWFRHYAGMMRDEKLVSAALRSKQSVERVVWVWGAILESATEINDGGRYEIDAGEIAYFLRADECDIKSIEAALEVLGRVHKNRVGKWGERQFLSDSSAERQRRFRSRHANRDENKGNCEVETSGNVTVTSPSRSSDAAETETETETETDKKDSSLRSLVVSRETSDWPSDYREQFWNNYPRKKAKKAAFKTLDRLKKSNEVMFEKLMAAVGKIPIGEPKFIPHPATWLNAGQWDDEQLPGEQNGTSTGNITPAIDGLIERVRDFDRPPDICGTAGKTAVRMLPEGGRERPENVHGSGDGDLGRISAGSDPLRH